MGMSTAPRPPRPTPLGMSDPNVVTGAKPVATISPDQGYQTPAESGYTTIQANAQPDNPYGLDSGASDAQDTLQRLRARMAGNRPFFGAMY